MDDRAYRIRLLRVGILVVSAACGIVLGVQLAQGEYGEAHASVYFFVGCVAAFVGSIVIWVRDARRARSEAAAAEAADPHEIEAAHSDD